MQKINFEIRPLKINLEKLPTKFHKPSKPPNCIALKYCLQQTVHYEQMNKMVHLQQKITDSFI